MEHWNRRLKDRFRYSRFVGGVSGRLVARELEHGGSTAGHGTRLEFVTFCGGGLTSESGAPRASSCVARDEGGGGAAAADKTAVSDYVRVPWGGESLFRYRAKLRYGSKISSEME